MSSLGPGAHVRSLQLIVQVLGDRDLLQLVLGSLPLQDLCISAAVCRLWRDVTSDASFWMDVNFEKCNVLAQQVRPLPLPRIGDVPRRCAVHTPGFGALPGPTCSGLPHVGGNQHGF